MDLDFQCIRAINGDLIIRFDYLRDVFASTYIDDIHASLHGFVQRLCDQSSDAWMNSNSELAVRVPSVEHAIRQGFNETERRFEEDARIALLHQGFLRQIQRNPASPAVSDEQGSLSYGQLAVLVALFQSQIHAKELNNPSRVAVVLPKGRYQVAACLAILSLGHAYVPVEQDSPAFRVATIIEEANCRAVMVDVSCPTYAVLPATCSVVVIDTDAAHAQVSMDLVPSAICQLLGTEIRTSIAPHDEAYLIFTSGSTGKPKGVIIQHQAVVNTINDLVARWSLSSQDTFLGLAKLSFDLSVFDIFAAMTVGGKLVLPPSLKEGEVHDPQVWLSLFVEHQVTIWNSVPMMAQMLISTRASRLRNDLASLRVMLLSGDRFPVDLAKGLLEVCPSEMLLYSGGGATEASVWSVLHRVTPQDFGHGQGKAALIPYGKPMYNQTMFVLQQTDADHQTWHHAPSLVPGKLFIGGLGLAKGYTDVDKTRSAFVEIPGLGRLYDTGDIVRFLPSGELEFLGRRDLQVKIRGHRIELEEINFRLKQIPGVHDCAIKVIDGQLVGFAVPRNDMPTVNEYGGVRLLSDDLERLALKADLAEVDDSILRAINPDQDRCVSFSLDTAPETFQLVQSRRSHYKFDKQPPSIETVARAHGRAHHLAASTFDFESLSANLPSSRTLSLEHVLSTLSALVGQRKESGSFKYRYPSAGGTYSVRLLLQLCNIDGAQDGVYLVDQKVGSILLLSDKIWFASPERLESHAELMFVSHLPAIAPLYGDATPLFTQFEKGYMLGSMADAASKHGLRFHLEPTANEDTSRSEHQKLISELGLDRSQYLALGGAVLFAPSLNSASRCKIGKVDVSFENKIRAFDIESSSRRGDLTWKEIKVDWDLSKQPLAFHHNAPLLQAATSVVTVASSESPVMSAVFAQLFMEVGISSSSEDTPSLGWTQSPWICDDWASSFEEGFGRKHDIILLGGIVSTEEDKTQPNFDPLELANEQLSKSLPAYMLLSSLMPIFGGLPLSGNGKIDHTKLLELHNAYAATTGAQNSADGQYPETPQEVGIAQAMAEALDVPVASILLNSSFFQLGGNSLSSIKLQGLLRQRLDAELDLKTIFRQPTVKGIDAAISKVRGTTTSNSKQSSASSLSVMARLEGPEHQHEPFPLTAIQEAYLLGRSSAFTLGNIATHAYLEFETPSSMTPKHLTTIIHALVKRHDAMRLVFDFDTQMQRVLDIDELPQWEVDYIDVTEESNEVALSVRNSIRDEMSHQVLAPDQWPLFDIRLSRASEQNSSAEGDQSPPLIMHVSLDMLIMDFFSSAILAGDLVEAFKQLNSRGQIEMETPPVTFRQFVVSEHKRREDAVANSDREYWLSRANDFPLSGPDLPLAKHMDAIKTPKFRKIEAVLPRSQMEAFEANAAAAGVTASAAIATAFGRVLTRYSETTTNFAINLTVFSRPAEYVGIDQVMGDFTTSILLNYDDQIRTAASTSGSSASFATRASRLNLQLLDDVGHASGFSGIEFARHLRSKTGQDVVYPVVMTCVLSDFGASHSLRDVQNLLGDVTYSVSQTPQVSIDFQCVRKTNGDLSVRWDYLQELFHDGFIDEAHAAFVHILTQHAEDKHAWSKNVSPDIDLVRNENVIQRLEANNTLPLTTNALPTSNFPLLHTGFLRHLSTSHERICITDAFETVTYLQLAIAVHDTLSKLKEAGVVTGDRVAVLMPKSWQQAAACLAILSHGCSYVPVEISQPRARIETILSEAQCAAVVTNAAAVEQLSYVQFPVIAIKSADTLSSNGSLSEELATQLLDMAESIDPNSEAYVIFTSGSTGKPKGVRMSHAAAMNTINDLLIRWNCHANDVFFGLANLSFDLSVFDLFASLTVGAHLVLPSGKVDANEWAHLVQSHGVTIWNSVPMHILMVMAALADDDGPENSDAFSSAVLKSVRICLLSGDKVPVDAVQTLRKALPDMDIYSGGGATEAGIWSILYPISRQLEEGAMFVPYGRSMHNQSFYVLNSQLEPCPTFVAGELFIGGDSLALGYTDTQQTRKAFIDIDIDGSGPQRLYRTADFGRFLASGDIQILGRKDDQIKIRGHRVELGEIETRILEIPGILEAVVVLNSGASPADVSLHAFVTQAHGDEVQPMTDIEIRHCLESSLPRYMIPSSISIVDKLQISANGKVDRKSLASKVSKAHEVEAAEQDQQKQAHIEPPSNNVERSIRAIWANILKMDAVLIGCDQDFFSLGGNSLSAVRVLTTIKRTYGVKVDVTAILQHPTVQSVALHICKLGIDVNSPEVIP